MSKILIKNGKIINGIKAEPFVGDVLIVDDKIKSIGHIFSCGDEIIIDATDKIVSPGFIDTHCHSDLKLFSNPTLEEKIRQGITTEIIGQDGISMAPLPLEYIDTWKKYMAGINGENNNLDYSWESADNFLKEIEKVKFAPNELYLLPHGNVRMEAIGLQDRIATFEEIEVMKKIVRRELEAGAAGLSSGLIYMPCSYSDTEELIEICKVVAEFKRPFVVHQRSEGDSIIESMNEIVRIGRESGVHIHFSHLKICGQKNWDKMPEVLNIFDKCKEENIKVSFDFYPYIAGSTMLGAVLPSWVHSGGTEKLVERLKDKTLREKIKKDMETGLPGWDSFVGYSGFEGIYITSVKTGKNKEAIGKNLSEWAKFTGKNNFDATFDLLLEEENGVGMYINFGKLEHLETFLKLDECNICTDALATEKPHPRAYGTFPKIINEFVKEKKVLSIQEAIYKMTYKSAETFGIKNRGAIKEDYFADVVIFDEKQIKDNATFIDSMKYPTGIETVIVNGELVLFYNEITGELPGKVIRLK